MLAIHASNDFGNAGELRIGGIIVEVIIAPSIFPKGGLTDSSVR
jgi:hypothetical protein